jgi:hypothetical protein
MEIKMQAALEKKDQEQKMELMEIKMQAAFEKKDLEQKMEMKEIKMQAALKMELMGMQAAFEKKDLEQKMEKKDLEQKMEKKDLEQKMELMEIKLEASLEKKDQERDREADKREAQHQIESERRDRLLEIENRDREADKKETQLKWEARVGQLEQQFHNRQPLIINPVENADRVNPAQQQRANEELMVERLQQQQLEQREKETGSSHLTASSTGIQAPMHHTKPASALLPSAARSSAPKGSTNALVASPVSLPTRPVSQQEQRQRAAAASASNAASRIARQQPRQQVATRPELAITIAVALPSDAQMHFFLSHCQGTGGDQTNAIYLELRQLGFACWYSALLNDLLLLTRIFLPS